MQGYDMAKKEFQSTFRDLTYAGYGLIFISHSTEKTLKDEKGEEYQQIAPALPQRPYDIVNKMVDVIGYIRETKDEASGERKRFIFFRGDDRFFAKSRFKYIVPRVEFSYDNIVNAIFDAIDEEVKHSGGEASDEINPYVVKTFDDLMNEAKELWGAVVQNEKAKEASDILEEEFGKPTRFSEILPEQIEGLKNALIKIKEIF